MIAAEQSMLVDMYAEMVRILDGGSATLPRALDGRVVRPEREAKSGVEGALVDVLALVRDEVQQ